jgi:hypothetical protein
MNSNPTDELLSEISSLQDRYKTLVRVCKHIDKLLLKLASATSKQEASDLKGEIRFTVDELKWDSDGTFPGSYEEVLEMLEDYMETAIGPEPPKESLPKQQKVKSSKPPVERP